MIPAIIGAVVPLIDKLIPDEKAREQAKLELLKQQQAGELDAVEKQLSAIIAEANSKDPWTSRARPSFMYVIYFLLVMSVPMGIVTAYSPEIAAEVTKGFKDWLHAMPEQLVWLFGAGYLGYSGARTIDKMKK